MLQEWLFKRRRLGALKKTQQSTMREFLAAQTPSLSQPVQSCEYLVADLEMTGLDPAKDQVISIGWVVIQQQQILSDSSEHHYLNRQSVNLDQTAPIHKIRHTHLMQGEKLEDVFQRFLQVLKERVLVVHHAPLDMGFINRICQRLYNTQLETRLIDTLQVERRRLHRQGKLETTSVRLSDCRARYNLPVYAAHNAAIDAIATAELWLAQLAHDNANEKTKLKSYV